MRGQEFHLHSMVVHAVIALAVLASLAFLMDALAVSVGGVGAATWMFLWRASLVVVLLSAVVATVTGISERNHMYVNWPRSHGAKLVYSLLLLAMVAAELWTAARSIGPPRLLSWLGAAVVVGNPAVCLALSYYGLRITLGRQSIGPTSYVPDMDRTPPVDILESAREHAAEPAKTTEVLEELAQ